MQTLKSDKIIFFGKISYFYEPLRLFNVVFGILELNCAEGTNFTSPNHLVSTVNCFSSNMA